MPKHGDTQNLSQQFLYPLDDPTAAFRTAMRDMGINLNRGNPFTDALLKNAQGARIAFLSDMSRNQGTTGYNWQGRPANVQSVEEWANPSQAYGNFLRSNLQSGNILGALKYFSQNFGNTLDSVRNFEDQVASGQNVESLNPYTSALRDIYRSNDGQGALSAYASLRAPLLGSIGTSWTRATQNAGETAMDRFYREGGLQSDPFDWLFGPRGRGTF